MTSRTFIVLACLAFAAPAFAGCLSDDTPAGGNGTDTTPTPPTTGGGEPQPSATGVPCASPGEAVATERTPGKPVAVLTTSHGVIKITLEREKAPITVGNFIAHAKSGLYDGTVFHRVIGPSPQAPNGFMIQGGDPLSKDDDPGNDGTGGPVDADGQRMSIPDEFHPGLRHDQGVISMANSGPNTGGSQFFITLTQTPHLDDKHAVFGRTTDGQDVVKAIGDTPTNERDRPLEDVVLQTVTIEEPEDAGSAEPGVAVHVPIAEKRTEASRPVTFVLVASNTGNVMDRTGVAAAAPEGWTCTAEFTDVEVPAGTARIVLVTVTPASDATGDHEIALEAWSLTEPDVRASTPVKVNVGTLGAAAAAGKPVEANYVGMLIDGRLFDTSVEAVAKNPKMGKSATWGSDAQHRYAPFSFTPGSGVIQGFTDLAVGAKEGEVGAGRMPPALAYGERGHDLAGKTLIFELEVLKVG